ncbi:hypothetical protein [Sphaerothrix gracilis]|uniref:hypothetical protein n=1 Tax=Sphaerothrix gracilis TaxID=3151835 RepID=UPI0031FD5918
MRKVFLTTAAALFSFVPGTITHAVRAENLYFTLENQTSRTLVELYLSPLNSADWEENILFSAVPQGGGGMIEVEELNTCQYKILAVFADDVLVEDYEVNLCELNTYTLVDSVFE